MKKFNRIVFLTCGLLLTLAAFPVLAQEENVFRPNKKPLENFAQAVQEKVESKQIDLTKSFSVELIGDLTAGGKLDRKTAKSTKGEGDAPMVEVGKSFIEAVNDSGLFYYLKQMGVEKIKLTLGQDDNQIYAVIASEHISVERAKTIFSGLNVLVKMALMTDGNGSNKFDADTKFMFNGIKVDSENKIVKINFNYEKFAVHEMINRKLKESEAKRLSGQ